MRREEEAAECSARRLRYIGGGYDLKRGIPSSPCPPLDRLEALHIRPALIPGLRHFPARGGTRVSITYNVFLWGVALALYVFSDPLSSSPALLEHIKATFPCSVRDSGRGLALRPATQKFGGTTPRTRRDAS